MSFITNNQITNTVSVARVQDYTESELLALSLGFVEVPDEKAFRGRYFIKNGKKWIHNLGKLRAVLTNNYGHYVTDEKLSAPAPEGFGYDVESYYAYNTTSRNPVTNSANFRNCVNNTYPYHHH